MSKIKLILLALYTILSLWFSKTAREDEIERLTKLLQEKTDEQYKIQHRWSEGEISIVEYQQRFDALTAERLCIATAIGKLHQRQRKSITYQKG